jgi:hypothetical protein
MTSEGKTDAKFISERRALYRLLNAIIGFFSALLGIASFLTATIGPPPPTGGEAFYLLMWLFAISFLMLGLLRNIVVRLIFKKTSHPKFLSLVFFGRKLNLLMGVVMLVLFSAGLLSTNVTLTAISFGLFFLYSPIYLMFDGVLLYKGEITILFELLFSSLDDFVERQRWLEIISKKLGDALKLGSIKVSSDNLVFYFNMKLLEETDIRDNLRNIEAWLLGKQKLCFNAIKEIIPENEFKPYTKNLLLKQTLKNPAIIKYVFASVLLAIVIITRPELLRDAFDLISKLIALTH